MATHDIVVIGASAGGVEALMSLARALPIDLPAAVFVVLHIPAHTPSVLPQLLARVGKLPVSHAVDREPVRSGRIYVAPPDRHMLLSGECVRLNTGPQDHNHRPAIDTLFRSAARSYGKRVIGVVLSGALHDGTAGLLAIKLGGGRTVVQDPSEASYPSMPRSALAQVQIDHVATLATLGPLIARLVREPISDSDERSHSHT
jgi:two-component system chemotaxis response regulator CheB